MDKSTGEFISSTSSSILSLAVTTGNPLANAVAQPCFKSVIDEFIIKPLTNKEQTRIGVVYIGAIEIINKKLKEGQSLRNDGFFDDNEKNAGMILEGTLLKARDEFEKRKLKFYQNLLANMCFDITLNYEKLNSMLKIIERLTYRQLQIIAYAYRTPLIDSNGWDVKFKRTPAAAHYFDFYSELMELYNYALLQQKGAMISMGGNNEYQISPMGKQFADLLKLDDIPQSETQEIDNFIKTLNAILR